MKAPPDNNQSIPGKWNSYHSCYGSARETITAEATHAQKSLSWKSCLSCCRDKMVVHGQWPGGLAGHAHIWSRQKRNILTLTWSKVASGRSRRPRSPAAFCSQWPKPSMDWTKPGIKGNRVRGCANLTCIGIEDAVFLHQADRQKRERGDRDVRYCERHKYNRFVKVWLIKLSGHGDGTALLEPFILQVFSLIVPVCRLASTTWASDLNKYWNRRLSNWLLLHNNYGDFQSRHRWETRKEGK